MFYMEICYFFYRDEEWVELVVEWEVIIILVLVENIGDFVDFGSLEKMLFFFGVLKFSFRVRGCF